MKSKVMQVMRSGFITVLLCITLISIISGMDKRYSEKFIPYTQLVINIESGNVSEISIEEDSDVANITMQNGEKRMSKIPSMESFSDLITQHADSIVFQISVSKPVWKSIWKVVLDAVWILIRVGMYLFIPYVIICMLKDKLDGEENSKNTENVADMLDLFGTKSFGEEVKSNVTFKDVAGIDEEKSQLQEIVEFLKNPQKYQEVGASIPKGILLLGPPGVGKTLLAKAVAGEAGAKFYQVTGSSFEEKFVGVGASRVRSLFKKAKENAPSIIFIDEIDAVAMKRYSTYNNYSEQTLNQLLAEMDGFKENDGVIVIAATNHKEVLDEAITRPGRFDRKIEIPMPDMFARKQILSIHLKGKKVANEVSVENIAKKTVGFSGADLANLLNEAAIITVNRKSEAIENVDIDEAFARIIVGLEKKDRRITVEDKRQTAIHEAGHAIVSMVVRDVEILEISIVPRGSSGGYNFFNNDEKMSLSKGDAIAELEVTYGGKAAEEVILGIESSGPASDLQVASKIALNMVTRYAMGTGSMITLIGNPEFDNVLIEKRLETANEICEDSYRKAQKIVINNQVAIEKLAELLMEKEVLNADEVKSFKNEIESILVRE